MHASIWSRTAFWERVFVLTKLSNPAAVFPGSQGIILRFAVCPRDVFSCGFGMTHTHCFSRDSYDSSCRLTSRGGAVIVYVWHKAVDFARSFLFYSCVYFCLYGPFNCSSCHHFSQQLSFFWLFFRSYLRLIGPFNFISLMKVSFSPDIIPSG